MEAEDFWIQREVERNPGYDDMVKDQASDMSGIFKLMEEYHQSQLQALKEGVEKRISNCEKFMARSNSVNASIYNSKIDAFEEVLNLITKLEKKT